MRELKIGERMLVGLVITCFVALLVVNVADGNRVSLGNLLVDFHLDSAPNKLPQHENAPIDFWGSAAFGTKDGTTPPKLERMTFEIDRFGKVETRGLPVCTQGELKATTVSQARGRCPGAIVGTGSGSVIIEFPEQTPLPAKAPLTFFNGPVIGDDPTLIIHSFLSVPVPTTYLMALRIERIRNGVYGFRIEAKIPPIAGGSGSITAFDFRFDRNWRYRGKRMSYIYARCAIGRLQARIETEFSDGSDLFGHFVHPCEVR
jgi:hypothetical protein